MNAEGWATGAVLLAVLAGNLLDLLLHIAAVASPLWLRAAQGFSIEEIRPRGSYLFEIVFVVNLRLVPRAVDEPQVLAFASILTAFRKQVLHEAAHGCNSRSGRDQNTVGERRA